MVLPILSTFISQKISTNYYAPSIATIITLILTYAYSQGRRTTRDRDLHARTIVLTGAFTPLGLTLLEHLAKKGAHIIVLLPTPKLTVVQSEILTLLRSTTSNEFIYAEPCPLESPKTIKEFCRKFATIENNQTRRIDALILAHEYSHIGTWKTGCSNKAEIRTQEKKERETKSLATFLLITLLLPAMLVAPADRDIRIINVVNPFYAAAVKRFGAELGSKTSQHNGDIFISEGHRALHTVIFTRHLQRILDALPSPTKPSNEPQKSNIMAVSVSPGVSRADTAAPFLLHHPLKPPGDIASYLRSWLSAILYFISLPLLFLLTKSPSSSMQSVLHVLCVPRPLMRNHLPIVEEPTQTQTQEQSESATAGRTSEEEAEEVLVPGALYADCSVVRLPLGDDETGIPPHRSQVPDVTRIGLGDEKLGRDVWEGLEEAVKDWEKAEEEDGKPPSQTVETPNQP